MIFENYNRGNILRMLERIKNNFGFTATTGIMQIKSKKSLSDEESISLAYDKLKNEIVQGNVEIDDEMQIADYAKQYNPDEDYSKSVSFIYQHLYEYINNNLQLKHEFYLDCIDQDEKERTKQQDISVCFPEKKNYVTLDDIAIMSGLKRKEICRRIKETNIVAFFDEEEVKELLYKNSTEGKG